MAEDPRQPVNVDMLRVAMMECDTKDRCLCGGRAGHMGWLSCAIEAAQREKPS